MAPVADRLTPSNDNSVRLPRPVLRQRAPPSVHRRAVSAMPPAFCSAPIWLIHFF